MSPDDSITIEFTRAEALVLFEYLARTDEKDELQFEDRAEQFVLWAIECMLDKALVEPFAPNYNELVEKAREKVRNEY